MNIYKATFYNNQVQSCCYVCESASSYSSYYCHTEDSSLAYAIIKATTLDNAFIIASGIIAETAGRLFAAA